MEIGFDYIGISTPFYCHDGKGRILLHKRSEKCRDEYNRWDPGSGKLEHGLSIEENILKEILEEYGCEGEIQEFLPAHDIFRDQEGNKTHWIAIPAFVKVDPNKVKIGEPEKMLEIGWFTIDELPEPLHSGFAHSFNNFNEHFRKYLK